MLSIKVDPARCDGCGRCTVACSMGRSLFAVDLAAAPGEKKAAASDPPAPLLWIDGTNGDRRIDICRHCEEPVCVGACVAGAIKPDDRRRTILITAEKCIGCWSCVMECPFQALRLVDGCAVKCNGCQGLAAPLCARFCPTGALQSADDGKGVAAGRRRERAVISGKVK